VVAEGKEGKRRGEEKKRKGGNASGESERAGAATELHVSRGRTDPFR